MSSPDHGIRVAAFEWLRRQVELHGDVLPHALLARGFIFDATRIPLMGPQGIFKPKLAELPLSITTAPSGPYDDEFSREGDLLFYKYRGTDPQHRDNAGLRRAMRDQVPLAYFHGIIEGRYVAVWPVYIVDDDPSALTFTVAVDDVRLDLQGGESLLSSESNSRRAYITATVRQRLHQRSFREKVLQAYREQCAMCRLRHQELLDAAHIIPDVAPRGEPVVSNGLALCKIHHAAFDRNLLGVTPDYVVQVRQDVLTEKDGPMLLHGLQGLHGQPILVPRSALLRPDRELLSIRFELFRKAS